MRLKHQIFVGVKAVPPPPVVYIELAFEDEVLMKAEDDKKLITEDNE